MTTPNPNDPYNSPPPQAPPPQAPMPGAPQYQAAPQYQGGMYGGGPTFTTIPGKPKTSRVMIFVSAGLLAAISLLGLLGTLADPEAYEEQMEEAIGSEVSAGIFTGMFTIFLLFAVVGIVLATRFGTGGSGVRTGAMVWAGLSIVVGLLSIPFGLVTVVLGILVLVFLSNQESSAWFNRPRQ